MEETETRFGVDLSKNEYLQFQSLLSEASAVYRFKGLRWVLTLVTLLMCGFVSYLEFKQSGTWDPLVIICAVLLLLLELYLSVLVPRRAKKQAAMAYDRTVGSGYSFEGYIFVQTNAIRKKTARLDNAILYQDCVLFIEHRDMMIFCSSREKAIAIPARFLTKEDADRLRKVAMENIPVTRQRLLSPLVPLAQQRMEITENEEQSEDEVLLSLPVSYSKKEFQDFMTDCFFDTFPKQLTAAVLIAVLIAIFVQVVFEKFAIPVFLLGVVVVLLLNLLVTNIRAGKAITASGEDILHLWVRFTDRSLLMQGSGENSKESALPWSSITRVVEQPDKINFYSGSLFLTIPKHCVENFDELKKIVDSHMKNE